MKISIIIPVFNTQRTLSFSIDSVLKQTYQNWELLLIDDGSTDDSRIICKKYTALHKNIQYYHKTNGGLSSARNRGLKNATGDYILFLDSDDYIHPKTLELLSQQATLNPDIDFIQFRYAETFQYNEFFELHKKLNDWEIITDEKEFFRRLINLGGNGASACTKFYKKSVFQALQFKEGIIYEDEFFTTRLLAQSHKIGYCSNTFYYYIMRKNSIIHTSFSPSKLDAIMVREDRIFFLKQRKYHSLVERTEADLLSNIISLFIAAKKAGFNKEAQIIKKYFKKHFNNNNPFLSFKLRLIGLSSIFLNSLSLYYIIHRLVKR